MRLQLGCDHAENAGDQRRNDAAAYLHQRPIQAVKALAQTAYLLIDFVETAVDFVETAVDRVEPLLKPEALWRCKLP